jgi:hypothetical protein
MVEDFWRSFLAVARQNPQVGAESILRFNERMQSTAALMEKEQADIFLRTVEEERELLFNEYERNPDALKRRLGLETNVIQSTIPKSLDPESIRAAAQSDYEVLRQMASAPGATVIGTGAEIDAELNRRVREHVAGMSAIVATTFTQIYNAEYNRLVTARLQQRTGCMVPIVIGTTILFSVLLSYTLLAAVLLG